METNNNEQKIDPTVGWIVVIIGFAICGVAIYFLWNYFWSTLIILGSASIVLHLFVKYALPKLEKKYLDEDGNWKEKEE